MRVPVRLQPGQPCPLRSFIYVDVSDMLGGIAVVGIISSCMSSHRCDNSSGSSKPGVLPSVMLPPLSRCLTEKLVSFSVVFYRRRRLRLLFTCLMLNMCEIRGMLGGGERGEQRSREPHA